MPFKSTLAVSVLAGTILLAGCGTDVTMYKPGVYQGKQDAAASQQAADARADDLRNRAASSFADR